MASKTRRARTVEMGDDAYRRRSSSSVDGELVYQQHMHGVYHEGVPVCASYTTLYGSSPDATQGERARALLRDADGRRRAVRRAVALLERVRAQ